MNDSENTTAGITPVLSTAEIGVSPSCDRCRFSEVIDENDPDLFLLRCCRFPPTAPVMDDGEWCWYFPEVQPSSWCGEFSP